MVNKLAETKLLSQLTEQNEVTDEFLVNKLDHSILIEKVGNQFKYILKISVGPFVPTNFKLKLKNKSLLIKASRELVKSQHKQENEYISNLREFEEFKREINLPDFVQTNTLTCYLEVYEDSNNYLFVEGLIAESTSINVLNSYIKARNESQKDVTHTLSKPTLSNKIRTKLHDCSTKNAKVFKSIDEIKEKRVENYSTSRCLKYKFELRDFDSNNINISIRNKSILVVYAYETYLDLNGKPAIRDFNHEINLPKNIELCNIRNCYDETYGTLRIEIPLTSKKTAETNYENKQLNDNDKYLELMFDLKDFKYENIEFYKNKEMKNVLVVKASKENDLNDSMFERKYVLPDWVGTENLKIFEETTQKDGIRKNLLVLNLPFV